MTHLLQCLIPNNGKLTKNNKTTVPNMYTKNAEHRTGRPCTVAKQQQRDAVNCTTLL